MDLELRHLKIVRAVAESGSVTKAATRLGLAQPSLTAQLKRIERTLGGPLFERDRNGARPTPLGEMVLSRARVLLPAVRELQEDAVRFANKSEDIPGYRIGATHGPILGGLVERLTTAHPATPVTTRTSWSAQELTSLVSSGRLDFALVGTCGDSPPPQAEAMSWSTVAADPVFVLLPEDHPLAEEKELELSRLAGESWAVAPGDGCFADCFAGACARAGFVPLSIYETDVATCLHLVGVGKAVALCQATFQLTAGLVMMPLVGTPLRWRHLLGWHDDSIAARVSSSVVHHARAAHADTVRRSHRYADWLVAHPQFRAIP
ncbi:LysR family transcriptional regulator [Planotetraspora silvatica]|uniref:LysR family transcriptional regulator n=1 Tax=Planotetraspora silvatica TaxID=234614 RepID=A0A8J3XSD1_9ACTN|nr:LysR family transcriptional regulator [Planotetraspora silvatica]GII51020.1 LysR family transcriptional regulator [Planotetraspora silvatica]